MKQGLVLFGHGARDARWAEPFLRLRDKVAAAEPEARVVLAFLELMPPDLETAVRELAAAGCGSVTVMPVFFGQGGHVRNDLPQIVARIAAAHPALKLRVCTAIGENDTVLDALAAVCRSELRASA